MSYTINTATNEVTRDSDGVVVSPCQSVEEPGFIEYIAWINEGNHPTETYEPPVIIEQYVPQTVTMRQARLAMLNAGILHLVDDAIAAMPSPDKETAQINWEYASEIARNDTMVGALALSLGMTEQNVDELFIVASQF
jgi:hypothetical protein